MSSPIAQKSGERMAALDGMRGIAALVVMIYHLSLVARPFLGTGRVGDPWWWLTETPFKVLTAGTEAVLVFFVLSGLVVALPALRDGFSWRAYYATRLLRLYLPVWGALLLAALLIWLIPRHVASVTPGSWADVGNATVVSLPQLLSEASLWRASYDVDNVLWSLRWEVIFSLALPLFVGVALWLRRLWLPCAIVAALATVLGRVLDIDALVYLPVFFAGTMMAVHLTQLLRWCRRRGRRFWVTTVTASLILMTVSFLARPVFASGSVMNAVLWGLAGLGATGLILAAVGSPAVAGWLSRRIPQWLGRISFSLYLVHVPIIATVTFAVGDERWWLVALISVPVSLCAGALFYRVAERPSHALARRAGRIFSRRPVPTP
jgi:peptidoglycan/LPS O-acetylase OafA/YrhL